jgi:hypothetical protein
MGVPHVVVALAALTGCCGVSLMACRYLPLLGTDLLVRLKRVRHAYLPLDRLLPITWCPWTGPEHSRIPAGAKLLRKQRLMGWSSSAPHHEKEGSVSSSFA